MTIVGKCPKCLEPINDMHSVAWCVDCGEPLPSELRASLPKLEGVVAAGRADAESAHHNDSGPNAQVAGRYRDAYRVGLSLVGLGDAFKIIGAILAGLLLLGALKAGGAFVLVGLALAMLIGALFWVCGVVVSAQGQILQATLDTAVSVSPFLSDAQRVRAMGLSGTVTNQRGS